MERQELRTRLKGLCWIIQETEFRKQWQHVNRHDIEVYSGGSRSPFCDLRAQLRNCGSFVGGFVLINRNMIRAFVDFTNQVT